MKEHTAENDALSGLGQKASLPDPREDTTVPDVARLFSRATESESGDREMKAFVAGWFAHARNPERLVVEDAWRVYRTCPIPPGKTQGMI